MKNEKEKIQENYDSETIIKTEKGLSDGQFVCIHCGASDIKFDEKVGKLCCSYCKSTFVGKELLEIETNIFNLKGMKIGSGAKDIRDDVKDIITLKCDGCGAEVVIDTRSSTQARCHWCRSILSINSRIENGTVPDAILPFKVKKEQATRIIDYFVQKRNFFALPKFKEEFKSENIMGVYFPYMLIDVNAHCQFAGEGEHLIRSYVINKKTKYDAEVYNVKREFDITIDNLTIEANKDKLNKSKIGSTNNIINSIMPFDTEKCVKFQSNYLVGFTSEKRDLNIEQLEFKVNDQIKDIARHAINKHLTYFNRGVRWENEKVEIKGSQWITAYLPVWLYSYYETKRGKKNLHYIAVNARTREIMGSVPINKKRLLLVSIIMEFLVIFFPFFILDLRKVFYILFFLHIFPINGFAYYAIISSKYRNKQARHTYENETIKKVFNVQKEDSFITKRRMQSSKKISGANNTTIHGD